MDNSDNSSRSRLKHSNSDKEAILPMELWGVIVIKMNLPLKLLVRLRRVNKDWYTLLSSHDFAIQQLQSNPKNRQLVIANKVYTEDLKGLKENREASLCISSPPNLDGNHVQVCTCNGIVLMMGRSWCRDRGKRLCTLKLVLWNPSIKITHMLPSTKVSDSKVTFLCGVGTDCNSRMKVIQIEFTTPCCFYPLVSMYDLETRAWRNFRTNQVPELQFGSKSSPVFVNGSLHWIGEKSILMDGIELCYRTLISFDMSREKFTETCLPTMREKTQRKDLASEESYLIICGDVLAVAQVILRRASPADPYLDDVVNGWVRNGDGDGASWQPAFKLDLSTIHVGRPLHGTMYGDLICCAKGYIFLYKPENSEVVKQLISRHTDTHCDVQVYPYMETLYLLKAKPGGGE